MATPLQDANRTDHVKEQTLHILMMAAQSLSDSSSLLELCKVIFGQAETNEAFEVKRTLSTTARVPDFDFSQKQSPSLHGIIFVFKVLRGLEGENGNANALLNVALDVFTEVKVQEKLAELGVGDTI